MIYHCIMSVFFLKLNILIMLSEDVYEEHVGSCRVGGKQLFCWHCYFVLRLKCLNIIALT